MQKIYATLLLSATLFAALPTWAVDKSAVPKKWHTPYDLYLSAQEAFALKTGQPDEVLFIDVRTRQEIHYIGMADQIDAHIPYKFDSTEWRTKSDGIHGSFGKTSNPDFSAAVENALTARGLDKSSPVIIMCTSGSRAPYAAKKLHKAGFEKVYTQVEGFEGLKATSGEHEGKRVIAGWKFEGLPWSYDLVKSKMYFNFAPKPAEIAEPAGK